MIFLMKFSRESLKLQGFAIEEYRKITLFKSKNQCFSQLHDIVYLAKSSHDFLYFYSL